MSHLIIIFSLFCFLLGPRIRRARVIKCNRFPRQKGGHGPWRSMRRPRKLGTRTRHCSLVTEFGALGRKLWQVSRLIRSSRIQRCRSFSERVGPRVIFLKASQVSSCSKRSGEITTLTESIAILTKNRQSMTSCGLCCLTIGSCFSVHYRVMEHAGSLESTKEA